MLQVNLSALNSAELRRLLDSSRQRGDANLSYQVLQEMAERRETPPSERKTRKDAEPRIATVELGEPEAEDDDLPPLPTWRPQPAAAAGAEMHEPLPSLNLGAADPEPFAASGHDPNGPDDLDLRLGAADPPEPSHAAPPPRPPRRPGIGLGLVTGFAVGAAVGLGLGWWSGGILREPRDTLAPVQVAAAAPPAAPAPEPAAAPQTPPDFASPPTAAATDQPATAPLAAQPASPPADTKVAEAQTAPPAAPKPVAQAAPSPDPEAAAPAAVKTAAATDACAAQPTPADRAICGDPALKKLQRDLQRAYAAALAAHEDKTTLRERQLAWRDARSTVTAPEKLTELYEERIRKLNAATAEARGLKTGEP